MSSDDEGMRLTYERPVSIFAHPEYLWVDGLRLVCIDLWEDTKDGAVIGGYVVVKPDGSHWAIDYGNPKIGKTERDPALGPHVKGDHTPGG